MVEKFSEKALRIRFQKQKMQPIFNATIKDITNRQKQAMRELIKDPTQSGFVKRDARATLKKLEKLK